jgi:ATP-dependent Clp protease ATP-binding subunit ClpA
MNYYQIQNFKREVYPAILIDRYTSPRFRKFIRRISFWGILIFILGIIFSPALIQEYTYVVRALVFLSLSTYILLILTEAMYRSCYFAKTKVDIRVLKILDITNIKDDLTTSFLNDELGKYAMYRLGFSKKDLEFFLKNKTDKVTKKEFEIIENDNDEVSFAEFGASLIHFDTDLRDLCRKKSITHKDFKQCLEWVAQLDQDIRDRERWWKRESLLRFPSIGKNLSFGQIYYLEQLGHNIISDTAYIHLGEKYRMYKQIVLRLEGILSKNTGGNLILTARESYIPKDALASLAKYINMGKVLPILENKRIYVLETNLLISSYEENAQFEDIFYKILHQASRAGNVILILPEFAEFIEHAHQKGVDIKSILREFLQSTNLQIIATSNEKLFHESIETDIDLMTHFEKIHLPEFDQNQTFNVLQKEVMYIENKNNIFFTYQSIKKIIESADRYFAEMSLLDKSIDLLNEILVFAKQNNNITITEDLVDVLISSKTGLSVGAVSRAEAQNMSTIKEKMSSKIIGQDQAVESTVDAMMRARAGFAHPHKPLASFLFVGPTGVGKTETAKVLAELFFGDENQMLRSDMSEYATLDAVERMIGDSQQAGIFASKIREKGSGVLLLDEFEKASSDVHNLFLQIIDEGFFTDGRGERVVMRNFIIIATSNAGSELWNMNSDNIEKEDVIQYMISKNVFKSELLNRFDEIIAFNSLDQDTMKKIISLTVLNLIQKLDSKGIVLKETPELQNYILSKATQSQFGAREIHKIIKKEIESKIAQALVLGDLFEGDTISFTIVQDKLEIQKYI